MVCVGSGLPNVSSTPSPPSPSLVRGCVCCTDVSRGARIMSALDVFFCRSEYVLSAVLSRAAPAVGVRVKLETGQLVSREQEKKGEKESVHARVVV